MLPLATTLALLTGCLVDRDAYDARLRLLTDDDGDGYSEADGDCNDALLNVSPAADEVCDALDNDCDGSIDEEPVDSSWALDGDGDGAGDVETVIAACEAPGTAWTADVSDCDDSDAAVHPGADELCNGEDDDCDGSVDEDAVETLTWYPDKDGDGYGDESQAVESCEGPSGYVLSGGDCEDSEPDVNPDGIEICGDGFDNDCDGTANNCLWESDIDMTLEIDISGVVEQEVLGKAVQVSDIDGDGANEVLISASYAYNSEGVRTGALNVFETPIFESLDSSEADMRIWGDCDACNLSHSFVIQDVNSDGYDDLIVGELGYMVDGDIAAGRAYLL